MKTVLTNWEQYNKIEKGSVIVQIVVSVFVVVCAGLSLANVFDSSALAVIGMGIVMITQGVREWRRNRALAIFSFAVAIFVAVVAVSVFLRRGFM